MEKVFSDAFISDIVAVVFAGLVVHDGAVLQHHECLDGSGYPSGTDNPIAEARILAVADVFDAMTSSRPYRAGKSQAVVIELMYEQEGARLDGSALDALSNLVLPHAGV